MTPLLYTLLLMASGAFANFGLIVGVINNVNSVLQVINTNIVQLNSSNIAVAGPALLEVGKTILPGLESSVVQIQSSDPLNRQDTMALNTARVFLDENVKLTLSDLEKQKPLLDGAGLSGGIVDILQSIRDRSSGLFVAVNSRLDSTAPGIEAAFNGTLARFDETIALFKGGVGAAAAAVGAAAAPVTGTGTLLPDGSCMCSATCSSGMMMTMKMMAAPN